MKLESDFYSLPRDGQSAEEHLCDEGGSRRALGFYGPQGEHRLP
jgi:hypothetical protein